MSVDRERLAGLYYRSGTLKVDLVDGFEVSAHRDNPELPRSPWYMHFPKPDEAGYRYVPEMCRLAAAEWARMAEEREPTERTLKVTGVPEGAVELGRAYAKTKPDYPDNFVEFSKVESSTGRYLAFPFLRGRFVSGDEIEPCEDHITAARNNVRFIRSVRLLGFHVAHLNVIVDRQQGARENLKLIGVALHSIFTADEILAIGLASGDLKQDAFDVIQTYRARNQY